jgi:dienelactone hydrolase
MTKDPFEIEHRWIHLQYTESTPFVETYGFSGNQGTVNLEGVLMTPRGCHSKSLLIYMHPSSTLQLLPVPRAAVRLGAHVLCAGSRYAKNDSSLVYEKVVLDLGAYVKYAKDTLRYEKIILVGWSGGGALTLFYQSQAERPDITHTPAGDPIDIRGSDLIPADAIVVQAAHYSRAQFLLDLLDPSVTNELDPDNRDSSLDLYDHANSHQLPYSPTFVSRYRQAQRARMDAITRWVKEMLYAIKRRTGGDVERAFVTHRTMADPRYLDPNLDPNDRRPGWSYLGEPRIANTAPAGLARFSTLRSWLSQWSIDDSRADGLACATRISVPLLTIENSADDAVPQPHTSAIYRAASSADKTYRSVKGATHYYVNQPEQLSEATHAVRDWLRDRSLSSV